MKKIIPFLFLCILLGMLIACSKENPTKTEPQKVSFKLEKHNFTYTSWKMDGSHTEHVKGKLLAGDKPIYGAALQITDKRIVNTDKNGEISFLINKNKLAQNTLKVVNVNEAKIDGEKVNVEMKKSLLKIEDQILVYYPITINKIEENKENKALVDVYAQANLHENEKYPSFVIDKYKISGTIKDYNGKPLKGATANLRRDGVEGFTMSYPSNAKGEFYMYYLPEDEEAHFLNVVYKGKTYTLPDHKAYFFPEDKGVTIDIALPKYGTIIQDKPPTLVTKIVPGALYKATIIGVNSKEKYKVTIPKEDGTFILTLKKSEWAKNPTFFETRYSEFLLNKKKSGDTLTSDEIQPPNIEEPNHIRANIE
ncbi:carboxypeptidase-like regulatory domain-containing protein [Rummeliibacillus sp. JY-2-4R]